MLVCATAAQAQTLTITTPQVLPQAITSEPITPINLEATGGSGNYTWSSVNGTVAVVGIIAPGLSVTSGGQIIGTPTTPQASTGFTVRVTDNATAKTVTKTLSIVIISDKPKLSLAAMNAATAGANYTWPFTASEGKTPYTWSSNGTLPQGLTLNSTTGVLSGMVSESQSPGNFTLSITVTGNNTKSASGNFVLGINPVFVWVTAPLLPNGKVATPYSANLTVSGGKEPRSFVTKVGSALPVGLTLNGTTGRLSGTPTTEGNYTFTITAKDSSTPVGTRDQTFTLVVESYGMSVSGPEMISGQRFNAVTPGTLRTAVSTSWRIRSLRGQAGVVNSMAKLTLSPVITTFWIILRDTKSPPNSGSWTVRKASRICASLKLLRENNAMITYMLIQ